MNNQKMQCIVLSVIKYTDRNSIAHVYSNTAGRMSLLVTQGNTKGTRMRNALMMPLSVVECELRTTRGSELFTISQPRRLFSPDGIYGNPIKSAIALFISELLSRTIIEQEPNPALWNYITASIRLLSDIERGVPNFHICFVWHLAAFLGIQPDVETWHKAGPKPWFHMEEGVFCPGPTAGGHFLNPDEALALWKITHIQFSNMHLFRFTREQRRQLLELMIEYLRIHHNTIGTIRSLDVLKEVFD